MERIIKLRSTPLHAVPSVASAASCRINSATTTTCSGGATVSASFSVTSCYLLNKINKLQSINGSMDRFEDARTSNFDQTLKESLQQSRASTNHPPSREARQPGIHADA